MEFKACVGEVLDVPVELTNEDGTPYSVTGTVVLRIAQHWSNVAVVEETVSIADPDTPVIQYDTSALTGDLLYSIELWETEQPLRLSYGLLWLQSGIATVPA